MANSDGKVKVVAKVTINAAPDLVYEYLADLKYHFLWNPHLRTLSPIKKLQTGTVYKSSSFLLGVTVQGDNKVAGMIKNKQLRIENQTGLIKYNVTYNLTAEKSQTGLVCTTLIETDYKPLHHTAPIMRALARRELRSDLQALKIAVESRLEPKPARKAID